MLQERIPEMLSTFAPPIKQAKLRKSPQSICWALSLAMMACGGCSSSDLVHVSGVVTLDGAPVTSGQIEFFPEKGRPVGGAIDAQGQYKLTPLDPGEGIPPGKYQVTITSRSVTGGGSPPPLTVGGEGEQQNSNGSRRQSREKPVKIEWHIPQRFSIRGASGLSAEVSHDNAEIDFDLVSKR